MCVNVRLRLSMFTECYNEIHTLIYTAPITSAMGRLWVGPRPPVQPLAYPGAAAAARTPRCAGRACLGPAAPAPAAAF